MADFIKGGAVPTRNTGLMFPARRRGESEEDAEMHESSVRTRKTMGFAIL